MAWTPKTGRVVDAGWTPKTGKVVQSGWTPKTGTVVAESAPTEPVDYEDLSIRAEAYPNLRVAKRPEMAFWDAGDIAVQEKPQAPQVIGEGIEAIRQPVASTEPRGRSQFVKSLETGGENVIGGLAGTLATVMRAGQNMPGKWYPNTPQSQAETEKTAKKLDAWAQTLYEDAQRPEMQPKKGSGPWQYVQHVTGTTLPFMAAAMAGGYAVGPAGAFLVGAAVEGDNAYRDAKANGASEEKAQLERLIVGTLNGAIEQMEIGGLMKLGKKSAPIVKQIVSEAKEKAMTRLMRGGGKVTGKAVVNAVNEGLEEALQESVNIGAATLHGDKIELKDLKRVGGAALGGAVAGGILGAPAVAAGVATDRGQIPVEPRPANAKAYEQEPVTVQPVQTMDELGAKMREGQGELPTVEESAPLPSGQPVPSESTKTIEKVKEPQEAASTAPAFFEPPEWRTLKQLGYSISEISKMDVAEGRRIIAAGVRKEATRVQEEVADEAAAATTASGAGQGVGEPSVRPAGEEALAPTPVSAAEEVSIPNGKEWIESGRAKPTDKKDGGRVVYEVNGKPYIYVDFHDVLVPASENVTPKSQATGPSTPVSTPTVAESATVQKRPVFVTDDEGNLARVVRWTDEGKPVVVYPGQSGGVEPGTAAQGKAGRSYEYILDVTTPATADDFSRQVRPGGSQKQIELRMWRDEFARQVRQEAAPMREAVIADAAKGRRREILKDRVERGEDIAGMATNIAEFRDEPWAQEAIAKMEKGVPHAVQGQEEGQTQVTVPQDIGPQGQPSAQDTGAATPPATPALPEENLRRSELAKTTKAIHKHPAYKLGVETAEAQGYTPTSVKDRVVYVERKYEGDVIGYAGEDRRGQLWRHITFDKSKGAAWDSLAEEAGLPTDFDGFMQWLKDAVESGGHASINEKAMETALSTRDPELELLALKHNLLKAGWHGASINEELEKLATDLAVDYGLTEDTKNDILDKVKIRGKYAEEVSQPNENRLPGQVQATEGPAPRSVVKRDTGVFGQTIVRPGTGTQQGLLPDTGETWVGREPERPLLEGLEAPQPPTGEGKFVSDPTIDVPSAQGGFVGGRPGAARTTLSAIVREDMKTGSDKADSFLKRTKGYSWDKPAHPLKKAAASVYRFVRAFRFLPSLPKTMEFAKVREAFRQIMEVPNLAYNTAVEKMKWSLQPVEGASVEARKRMEAVRMKLIADDLSEDAENGVALPPGLEQADVVAMKTRADELYNTYPTIRESYDRIRQVVKETTDMLVDEGWLSKEQAKEMYFPHKVVKYMRQNDGFFGIGRKPAEPYKGYLKKRKGGADYSTDVLERLIEHWAEVRRDIETVRFLEKVYKQEHADFRAANPEWKTGDAIPEGYREQVILPGRFYYRVGGVTEDLATALLAQDLQAIQEILEAKDEKGAAAVKKVLALGKKRAYIVREEIAKQTQDMPTAPVSDHPLYKAVHHFNTFTKRQILFNPFYAIPFHVTNMVGDTHKVLVAVPGALKSGGMIGYWKAIRAAHAGQKPGLFAEAQKRGVIGSGWLGVDVKKLEALIPELERAEVSGGLKEIENKVKRLFNTTKTLGQSREDWLRYATFEYLVDQQNKGVDITRFAVKDVAVVKGLDGFDKAAKIARDILGDYSAIGKSGVFLSDTVAPFYRWMHLNTPWWPRMIAEYAKRGDAGRLMAAMIAAAAPYMLAMLWNYSDDERRKVEEKLPAWKRWNFHIVVGGKVWSLPMPLDDVANFLGVPENIADFQAYQKGFIDFGQLVGRIAANMAYQPGLSVLNSVGGTLGVARDLFGYKTFPDIADYRVKEWDKRAMNAAKTVFGAPAQIGEAILRDNYAKVYDLLWRSFMPMRPWTLDRDPVDVLASMTYVKDQLDRPNDPVSWKAHAGREREVDRLRAQVYRLSPEELDAATSRRDTKKSDDRVKRIQKYIETATDADLQKRLDQHTYQKFQRASAATDYEVHLPGDAHKGYEQMVEMIEAELARRNKGNSK